MNELPLRDIHLPESISSWPPAMGWWLLPLILLLLIAAIYLYRHYKQQHKIVNYQKAALHELMAIDKQFSDTQGIEYLRQVSSLLRRIMLSYYPRETVASLTGDNWFSAIHKLSQAEYFNLEQQQLLIQAAYRPTVEYDRKALQQSCKRWIESLPKVPTEAPQ